MASIQPRGKSSFSVVYKHNGRQIWEAFKTREEANRRKLEIEYEQTKGTFVPPSSDTLEAFLAEYVEVYGTTNWAHSSYNSNVALIRNYVNPIIGQWKPRDITAKKNGQVFHTIAVNGSSSAAGTQNRGVDI